jgi:NADH:ubiquinone oxidoreductase subunit F (NADH-binding)
MVEILSRISEGQEKENDVESLREIALAMKDSALCTLGQNIPNPVLSFIDHFKSQQK